MAFVDYYAALNLTQEATPKDVQAAFLQAFDHEVSAEYFRRVREAQQILGDPNKRAAYDKRFGHLMVIQSENFSYPTGMVFTLAHADQIYAKFLGIVEAFKAFVEKRTQTTWDEAQEENYSFEIFSDAEKPYVLLRFSQNNDLVNFAEKLKAERMIKS